MRPANPPVHAARRKLMLGIPALAAAMLGAGCGTRPLAPASSAAVNAAANAAASAAANAVVPFSLSAPDGGLPQGWLPYVLRRDLPPTVYRTEARQGVPVLHAGGVGVSSGLRCLVDADPLAQPWLRWRWQAEAAHPLMTVASNDTDDSPARIVVAFEGDTSTLSLRERSFYDLVELLTGQRLPYATLMYVWDAQLPVGTVVPYARSSRIQYLVVESGQARAGHWLGYERNLAEDFRRVYGEAPGRISSVGVLTDSDDLKVDVNAWYGDIGLYAG